MVARSDCCRHPRTRIRRRKDPWRRHHGAGAGTRSWPHPNRAAVGLCAGRSAILRTGGARRGLFLQPGSHRWPPGDASSQLYRFSACGWLLRVQQTLWSGANKASVSVRHVGKNRRGGIPSTGLANCCLGPASCNCDARLVLLINGRHRPPFDKTASLWSPERFQRSPTSPGDARAATRRRPDAYVSPAKVDK